jgi:hypothetical protein
MCRLAAGSGGHYVRVRFDPTVQDPLQILPTADPVTDRRLYLLPSQQWAVGGYAFCHYSATTPSADADLAGVTMHNRVVTMPHPTVVSSRGYRSR